jgi:ABC-2 type transport system permease protein
MVGASLYILVRSTRNRIAMRLRRLREPRYLFGAVIGAAYLYFAVFRPRGAVGRRGRRGPIPDDGPAALFGRFGLPLGGAAVLLMAGLAWIFPGTSSLLSFTEAETDFLFPAPVSRRQLVIHRVIRSQFGLLFAAMVPAFLFSTPGSASIAGMFLRAIGLWITFVTIRVYFAGVTMARARLGSADPRARRVAWMPLVATVVALGVIAVPLARAILPLQSSSPVDVLTRAGMVMTTGLPSLVLWPFRALLRPLFADEAGPYLAAIPGALIVLFAAIAWVLKSDEVFQAANDEALTAHRPATERRQHRVAAPRVRAAGWPLALSGRTEMAFMWKNGVQTLRSLNFTSLWAPLIGLGFGMTGFTIAMSRTRGLASAMCFVAFFLMMGTTLLGPMSVMSDLRGDLRHLELLKTWPVKGAALIRGEMLWPAALLTVLAWFALTCGAVLSVTAFPRWTVGLRVSLWAAAILVVPALVFAQYTIHHAAAVMFPAWIPADNEMRGFDSMGQRLILFGGVLLGLIAMMLPGAVAAAVVGFVFYRLTGSPFVFVPAAGVCLAIVATEVMLATEALGPLYDRIDLSGVDRSE